MSYRFLTAFSALAISTAAANTSRRNAQLGDDQTKSWEATYHRMVKTFSRIAALCAATWLADVATKCWALNHDHAALITVVPGLCYALVPPIMNKGTGCIAPGVVLNGPSDALHHAAIIIPILLSIACFGWMFSIERRQKATLTGWEQVGFGMLLGGTFSNLYDRIAQNSVTDFLNTPIFDLCMWNVADVAVAVGLFIVGIEALRLRRLLPSRLAPQVGSRVALDT